MTTLNVETLHEAARHATGLNDFGDTTYLEGLREVIAAVAERPKCEKLEQLVAARIVMALSGRLYSEAGWRAHPEYKKTKITAPIMITGMSRSGTTALHQLLAMDEQFQWIPHWVAQAPDVRPPRAQWMSNPRYAAMAARLEAEHARNPSMRRAHNIGTDLAEECINVMCQSFVTMMFITTLPLPRYREWFYRQDETASYRRYADNLRLIGAETADRKPWLLKNPSHTGGMQALLNVFPDARIILTHRDPVAAVSSGASLSQIASGDLWEPGEAGRVRLEVGLNNVTRMQAARDKRPENFHDVDYRRFVADPMGVVRDVYRAFGLSLSAQAEGAMNQWIAENPQGKFGKHDHKPEQFGLDPMEIRRRFADYIKRYNLDN